MQRYYVDLHVHIGRTRSDRPVKITAARTLTMASILQEATERKGLNLIGVIDCHVPEVIAELEEMLEHGRLDELEEGGLRYKDEDVTLILGSEIELYDEHCKGPIHVLCYLPTIEAMKDFSLWFANRVKNITLSSQRIYEKATVLQEKVKSLGGLFIPAHIFTPFKSLYGRGVTRSLTEVFDPLLIDAVELGLSADTKMADQIAELHHYSFLSNSDAHSTPKLAREYQVMEMKSPSFLELKKVLKGEDGRRIVANYGLNPLLGKYHRTACERCATPVQGNEKVCQNCGSTKFIKGVYNRLMELKNTDEEATRPPYIHQVPLQFLPGIGPKTLEKLIEKVGTEMYILHEATESELSKAVKAPIVELILKARNGILAIQTGGGGVYGKIL
ncbi:endonuclease Q family protein [Priestia koreensis]|uniref:endonuclease Q family protein n=1 Tax=Priestia koreensis TaxID=284581 RepID=UPI0028F73DAE|nr:endonuclease Q family protein [Priestia koreensis]